MPGKDISMNTPINKISRRLFSKWMNTPINKISRRLFSKWMLLNMLNWFSHLGDDLGPVFALWTENPDEARPIILRLLLRHPVCVIHAIIDSLIYHYY